jgi:peptide/nickel transport system permease protein
MGRYILRRVLLFIPVWLGVAVLTFFMMHLIPGNPVIAMFGGRPMTEAAQRFAEHQLGLDRPLVVQLVTFVGDAMTGRMGLSWESHTPVTALIAERLPYTFQLAFFGLLLGALIGVPLGVVAAVKQGTLTDRALLVLSLLFISFPGFWLGLMLIYVFSVWLGWLPVAGATSWKSLVLPVVVLATGGAPVFLRLTRVSMLEVLHSDYVRTARAKGLIERRVVYRHALRNALNTVVTVVGLSFGSLLGGAFIVEQVFSRPGLGTLTVQAILARDYPLTQGIVLYSASIFLVLNLLIDILYAFIDPRIQYS